MGPRRTFRHPRLRADNHRNEKNLMNYIRMCFIAATLASTTVFATAAWAHGGAPPTAKATEPEHAAALSRPGDPKKVARTIDVDMSDGMRFLPAVIQIKR